MLGLGFLIWIGIAIYLLISRGLPQLLSWLCYRRFNVHVKIGKIGILSLSLKDIVIRKRELEIVIDSVGISSSLVNRNHGKLLVIYVNDVRIQKDEHQNVEAQEEKKVQQEKTSSLTTPTTSKYTVSHSLMILTQILSIHICNVNIVMLGTVPACLCHCSIGEIKLEGSSDSLLSQLSLKIRNATCKLLQPLQYANEQTLPCLAEMSFSKDLTFVFDPTNDMQLKTVTVQIMPEITLSEGFMAVLPVSDNGSEPKAQIDKSRRSLSQSEHALMNLDKFSNVFPEEIKISMKHVKFKVLSNHSPKTLSCDLKAFNVSVALRGSLTGIASWQKWFETCCIDAAVSSDELVLTSSCSKLMSLHRAVLNIKIANKEVDFGVVVTSFGLVVNEEELCFWWNTLPFKLTSQQPKRKKEHPKLQGVLSDGLNLLDFKFSLELWEIGLSVYLLKTSPFRMNCTHTRIAFDCNEVDVQTLMSQNCLLISQRFNCAEILIETLWCRLDDTSLPDNHCKKNHYWNTFFFLAVFLLTIKHQTLEFKWQGMVDNIRLEWSPALVETLLSLLGYIPTRNAITDEEMQDEDSANYETDHFAENSEMQATPKNINFHIKWTNVNVFMLTDKKVGLALCIDVASVEKQKEKAFLSVEGTNMIFLSVLNLYHPCLKSSELNQKNNLNLKTVTVTFKPRTRNLIIQLLENTLVVWSTKFHLMALQIVQDILHVKSLFTEKFSRKTSTISVVHEDKPTLNLLLKHQGSLNIMAVLSQQHKLSIIANAIIFKSGQQTRHIQFDDLILAFDKHDVFHLNGFSMSYLPQNDQLTVDRETFSDLILKKNKACIVSVDEIKVTFPHHYPLAEAFSEETLNIVKWLKTIHKKQKKEFTLDSPLPYDLLIKLKKINVEFCDDSFEVKLRDNFELLEDEYNENQKRWKMLDARIEELRRTHLMLQTGKVEELYANLQKKNTDVYIQRSRQMYSATPMRTSLGIWQLTNIEVLALADLTFHGKENVLKQMREIDDESPFPEEGMDFTTLWCRMIRASCNTCLYTLRDYPSPVLEIQKFHIWGRLIGAEQESNKRAKRSAIIEIDDPWNDMTIERSMPPLKFYHDISCEIDHFTIGYGPCWEPIFAHMNLSMDYINKPSADPSQPLPFWDKMRLLFHGRLTAFIQHTAMILHASLNPYNTTEEMDFTWTNLLFDWTSGKIVLKGDLDVYIRTASKYDDCHFLHIPNLKLSFKLDWLCLADPNDHHCVMPCAPDKLPEYSSNQEHDSYRPFRSLNLNMSITMETKPVYGNDEDNIPAMLFYSSTLRWLENLKNNLASVARPIRRGRLFQNCRPRKLQLGRHYKSLHFSLSLHQFEVCYWMSFAKLRGFNLKAGKLTLSSEHDLSVIPVRDGLIHRPRAEWNIVYMNCELNNAEIWLQSAEDSSDEMNMSFRTPVEKCYFLSLSRVSYGRETAIPDAHLEENAIEKPNHRLVLHDLRGAWTKNNKDIVFSMFDSYVNIKFLRRNLSTEALKGFKVENPLTFKPRANSINKGMSGASSPLPSGTPSSSSTPIVRQQSSPVIALLQQLISEADKAMVFSEDLAGSTREQQLHGVTACQTDDVIHRNWLIELINSQVLLKGYETQGYVIMSAAKAQILQCIHQPVWQDCRLVTKTTWVGSLECMQYYATVDPGELNTSMDNIMWVTVENIEAKESLIIADLPDLVGSGQGVGGVVSDTVGGADPRSPVQLQRIVSRCGCHFFYASYGENIDPKNLEIVPPLPLDDDSELWSKEIPVDSFTLTHHDLNCCTNSLQYAMILDIVNNLLLFVEPKKREYNEKLQRMRFQLQLAHIADQRTPILQLQNQVRTLLSNLRRLEREIYIVQRAMDEDDPNESLYNRMDDLERQIYECKVQLNAQAEELAMMISCFKEQQLAAIRKLRINKDQQLNPSRWNEVCFKHAQWRLTEADGQLGIADVVLSNFLYSKQTKNDDSVEHLLELGYMKVTNLLPNQIYKVVFQPTNLQGNVPYDRQCTLRIFCREKPPVGGISIKEHFEVNVVPLTLGLTNQFYNTMLKFCFPGKETEHADKGSPAEEVEVDTKSRKKHGQLRRAPSSDDQDDIEKMKERAEKNKMFLYIKIPEVPVKLSYKAEKEKNIKDVHDFTLVIPTLEYHNVTWTWLDFLLAMKNDSKKALLSQAIKQKLQIKSAKPSTEESVLTQEEDKVRLLLGSKLHGPAEKEKKRNTLFSRSGK